MHNETQREKWYREKRIPLKDLQFMETWQWLAQYAEDLKACPKHR